MIVPARTPEKAREALGTIPRVEQNSLDLLDPASIDAFASEFLASGRPLHMLINNAGIMAPRLRAMIEDMSLSFPRIIWGTFN